jgi:glycosyltransferase involved in cell wall biosynthesis
MNILFLDQTGKLAGAERVLLDIAPLYRDHCLVGLFEDGPFQEALKQQQIPVKVIANRALQVRRESSITQSFSSLGALLPLIYRVAQLSRSFDLIYVNTPKALVVGAIASLFSKRPLVYHLHDILTPDHFSQTNRQLMVALANRFATQVIAVSKAAQSAFIKAGGRPELVDVVYNGLDAKQFQGYEAEGKALRTELGVDDQFVVGHFSRFSPWKGQHVLIQALADCPENIVVLLVGDALFGEEEYAKQLRQQVNDLGLQQRVKFLGFRSDVPQLMSACDLITHTSTAPEPCSRVIIETMLCGKPLIASRDGGTVELVTDQTTGWLVPPGDASALAAAIKTLHDHPAIATQLATQAQQYAGEHFRIERTRQQIDRLLHQALPTPNTMAAST